MINKLAFMLCRVIISMATLQTFLRMMVCTYMYRHYYKCFRDCRNISKKYAKDLF